MRFRSLTTASCYLSGASVAPKSQSYSSTDALQLEAPLEPSFGEHGSVAHNIGYLISYTVMPINICRPVDAYWNQFNLLYSKKYSCIKEGYGLPLGAALSVLSDFYGCLLPVLLLRHLQMPLKQKVLRYCLFALGFV
jgi:hypothetical protein